MGSLQVSELLLPSLLPDGTLCSQNNAAFRWSQSIHLWISQIRQLRIPRQTKEIVLKHIYQTSYKLSQIMALFVLDIFLHS